MPRIKLNLPERFHFQTEIPIRISDINYGGHLGNDSVLSIVHEARVQFLKSVGYSEIDIEGLAITMADAVVVYTSEGFYGDRLIVEVAVVDIQIASCDFIFRLTNKATKKEIARVKTGIAFINKQTKKIAKAPDRLKEKLSLL